MFNVNINHILEIKIMKGKIFINKLGIYILVRTNGIK